MSRGYARVYVLLFAIIMLCPLAVAQKDKQGTLKVTVFGPAGENGSPVVPLRNVHVALRWNFPGEPMCWNDGHCKKTKQPHKKIVDMITDDGGFSSVALPQGIWDIFAYGDGFIPTCAQVFIEAGKTITVRLQLPGLAPHSQE